MSLKGLQKKSVFAVYFWYWQLTLCKKCKKSTYHVTKLEKVRRLYHAFSKWFMSNWKGFKNFYEIGIEYCHH